MKSKIFIIIGSIITSISSIFIINDKYTEYNAGIESQKVLNLIEENSIINENNNELDTINIEGYNYIGTINIPTLNIDLPVMDIWDYNRLKKTPCLYYGNSIESMIICAHSYKTHFKNIGKLKQEDYIIFTDVHEKKYIYKVEEVEILSSTDVDKMINNNFNLTLYTCTSDGLNRITVRCNLINNLSF